MKRRDSDAETGSAESDELERLCGRLGRVEAPFDELALSRAEGRLVAELAREPARRHWRTLGKVAWAAALVLMGAAAGGALVAGRAVPARSQVAGRAEPSLRFEPYVVAPTAAAASHVGSAVPEALVRSSARLDVPTGWLVRASLGDAVTITLTGPARAWSEGATGDKRTVVHLEQGRLLASLEGGTGQRLQILSPGAVTNVVGTLFSVEVMGAASRVAVAHGRVQVTDPGSSGAPPRAARDVAAGESWLTTLPELDELEPALAAALADHERTPPPRGATVPLSVTEAPAGAGVWVGKRRIASAPAWVLVEPHAAVRLSTTARAPAPPVDPSAPPSTEPSPAPSMEPSMEPASSPVREPARTVSQPLARALSPADPRPPFSRSTRPGAAPTEPPPLDLPPAAPEEVTARTLFREADAARAVGDKALALRTLRALVERFPHDSATAAAHYELALMEDAAGSSDAALRHLAAVDTPSLEEPTEYLRCRVLTKRAAQFAQAERCMADFRRRFPTSAHDADALATETALALARGGCPAAETLLEELERRRPKHGAAARLRAACGRRP